MFSETFHGVAFSVLLVANAQYFGERTLTEFAEQAILYPRSQLIDHSQPFDLINPMEPMMLDWFLPPISAMENSQNKIQSNIQY